MRRLTASVLSFVAAAASAFPSFDDVKREWRASDTRVLDVRGRVLQEARRDFSGRRLDWISLDRVPEIVRGAVLAAEDRRFFDHGGVDWRAAVAGAWRSVLGGGVRGASTIPMQVAGFLEPNLRPRGRRRGLWQKWTQMQAARDLSRRWNKDQILEAYLNLVTFRGEYRGIGAASRAFFDRDPHGLTGAEGALLAALIRSPNATLEAAAKRACALGEKFAPCAEVREVAARVTAVGIRPRATDAPQLARLLKDVKGDVRTTLDRDVQRRANEILRRTLDSLKDEHAGDGAVLVLDNQSGNVLAYVGNADPISQVDGVRSRRQAGSTLKPFLYAAAFDRRRLTPSTVLEDAPLDVPFARGVYRPANYDNKFRGLVSARTALAQSLNIPAVRVGLALGAETFRETLRRVGITGLEEAEHYGPSLALGTADVSLWELTNAYRSLANGGRWSVARYLPGTSRGLRRVVSASSAFLVADILSDRESRAGTFGWESPLTTRFWSAVKTGTSKDMRDNWCVGFTSEFTVGVWIGNFSGAPMWNVSGAAGAAPVWKELITWLQARRSGRKLLAPAGVARGEDGEWYAKGTEPVGDRRWVPATMARIAYPASGSRFAWDPDIPAGLQRVPFEAAPGGGRGLRWVLDGADLGSAADSVLWPLTPGPHRLALAEKTGTVRDEVRFEVRGGDEPEPATDLVEAD